MTFHLSFDLENEVLLDDFDYIKYASRIAQEIQVGLSYGEEYTLFTENGVTPNVRVGLKALKTALHNAFGDNGTRYYVTLQEIEKRKDKVAVVIKKALPR